MNFRIKVDGPVRVLMNPFNGIERKFLALNREWKRKRNPFNGIESTSGRLPVVVVLARIHSMELKVEA